MEITQVMVLEVFAKFLIIILTFIGAKIFKRFFGNYLERMDKMAEKNGIKQLDLTEHTIQLLKTIFGYAAYMIAGIISLYVLGLKDIIFAFITSAGIMGMAVGFASKDLVANVISGILVIFDRPFEIGDSIEIGKVKGKVKEITIRSTKVETSDGKIVSVPNAKLATDYIINYSKNKRRRVDLKIDIDIDSDLKKAMKIIDKIVDNIKWKSKSKGASITIADVTKDGVIISVNVWTSNKGLGAKKTELFTELTSSLKKAKIHFSVPRRLNVQR
ncbi:MAG: mechanosensitive ion channel family protein [Nanoarchaeota archaeon]|nr:mechanosensitive ion channel family protein [Nanoarchaeota archaeon]